MPLASEYLQRKRLLPSELRTAEWDDAHEAMKGTSGAATLGWCKERAFFMAGVARAEQLQAFRNVAAEVAAGRMNASQARQRLREWLAESGYMAKPGQEGTIKDLSSTPRLKVALDTNVALARGWAQHEMRMANVADPAAELYRAGQAKQPRDWSRKWADAAAAVGWDGVSPSREFVALKTSPIWRTLSRFDQPYPPFDFGSHMRVRSVGLTVARQAGLLTSDEELKNYAHDIRKEQLRSMNESVECTPQVSDRELREQLADVLQGIAEWKGDKLVMSDPNGTRPYPPEEIGRVITAPLPEKCEHRQAKAFREWVQDSSRFNGREPVAGLDRVEDVERLFSRIESRESSAPIYRGLHFENEEKMEDFINRLHTDGFYTPMGDKVADSFSSSIMAAEHYAGKAQYQAIIRLVKHSSAKDLRGLYKYVPSVKQDAHHPVNLEAEHVILRGTRLRILRKQQETLPDGSRRITYECEEE